MKSQEISLILLIITCIISIHAISSNSTLFSAIDEKANIPSSRSLNDSVCNQQDAFPFCSLEKDCFERGDCCLGLYSEEEEANIREKDIYEVYQHEDFYYGEFIKVVGRCPRNATNETEIEQCHNSVSNTSDPMMMFPMTSVNTTIIYKNWACGKCNEGSDTQFQLELNCLKENKLPVTIEEGMHLYLSNRSCFPTIPSDSLWYINHYNYYGSNDTIIHCPSSFHDNYLTKWRCFTYLSPFTFDGRRYKNIFCAQCNGVFVKQEDVVCRKSTYPTDDTYPFQIDANFVTGGEVPFSNIQSRCTSGSVYDPYQQQCRMIYSDSPTSFEDENILNVTDNSDTNSNALKRFTVPKCLYQIYNVTEYERNDNVFIKATQAIYQPGEYEILSTDENLEVCVKEKNESLPLCILHYCPSNNSHTFRSCSCNSNCFQKGDCCIDALTTTEFSSMKESDFSTCIRLSYGERVFAINQCPKNYRNNIVRSNCESLRVNDPFLETPVFSSLTNIAYKNIYCGVCHDAKDLMFIPFKISCDDVWNSRTPATAFGWTKGDNSKCTLTYSTELAPISTCDDRIEYKCPKDWELSMDALQKEVNSMCRTIEAPITVNIGDYVKDYRNIYCAQCNGIDPHSLNGTVQCYFSEFSSVSETDKSTRLRPLPRHLVLFTIG